MIVLAAVALIFGILATTAAAVKHLPIPPDPTYPDNYRQESYNG